MREKSGKKIVFSQGMKKDMGKLFPDGLDRADFLVALKNTDFSKGKLLSKKDPMYAECQRRVHEMSERRR